LIDAITISESRPEIEKLFQRFGVLSIRFPSDIVSEICELPHAEILISLDDDRDVDVIVCLQKSLPDVEKEDEIAIFWEIVNGLESILNCTVTLCNFEGLKSVHPKTYLQSQRFSD
jgi:hypothetical protein